MLLNKVREPEARWRHESWLKLLVWKNSEGAGRCGRLPCHRQPITNKGSTPGLCSKGESAGGASHGRVGVSQGHTAEQRQGGRVRCVLGTGRERKRGELQGAELRVRRN